MNVHVGIMCIIQKGQYYICQRIDDVALKLDGVKYSKSFPSDKSYSFGYCRVIVEPRKHKRTTDRCAGKRFRIIGQRVERLLKIR